jgi:hypothetical protein
MLAKCDENNLFVCKDRYGELMVVEVVEQEEPPDGSYLLVQPSPDRRYIMRSDNDSFMPDARIVPLASLVPFEEETYHRIAIILEEDAAASGYESAERRRLWNFHERARLALYTLATVGPDYSSEEGYQKRIEDFRRERLRLHPDAYEPEEVRCSRCRANPCYHNCLFVLAKQASMY